MRGLTGRRSAFRAIHNSMLQRVSRGRWASHSDCEIPVLILNCCHEFLRWRCDPAAAAGALDVALISANAQDWDLAACDLIVTEAGGRLINLRGKQPLYNRVHTLHGELIAGPEALLTHFTAGAGLAATSQALVFACFLLEHGSRVTQIDGHFMAANDHKQLLHLVFGGELVDLDGTEFAILMRSISSAYFPIINPPIKRGRRARRRPSTMPICAISWRTCIASSSPQNRLKVEPAGDGS